MRLYLIVVLVLSILDEIACGTALLKVIELKGVYLNVSPRVLEKGQVVRAELSIIPVLLDLNTSDLRHIIKLLQDHYGVSFLNRFSTAKDRGHLQITIIFHLLGMYDEKDVDVLFGC